MTFYFYYDALGKQHGPFDNGQFKKLVSQGVIGPATQLEYFDDKDNAYKFKAGEHPDWHLYSSKSENATLRDTPGIFDIGFTRFISNTWISIIWVLLIIAHFLAAIGAMMFSFNAGSPVPFLIALFAVPTSLLFCRMYLELSGHLLPHRIKHPREQRVPA